MFRKNALLLAGIACVSISAALSADSHTDLLESARAARRSASALVDTVNAALDARDAARLAAAKAAVADSVVVDTAVAKVAAVDSAVVSTPAAKVVTAPAVVDKDAKKVATADSVVVVDTTAAKVAVADSAVVDTAAKKVAVADSTVVDTAAAKVAAADSAVVDTAAAKVAAADSAVIDTTAAKIAAAPVKRAEKPAPAPPKIHPVSTPDIDMVFVKGGAFKMGCAGDDEGCIGDERPRHEVKLGNFFIGRYPVTQKQWASVMGINPSHFEGGDWASMPVEQVSWNEIQEFIRRLNAMTGRKYRLPTEAEWEYAARGGANDNGAKFEGHRFLDDIAWYDYNSGGQPHTVGGKQPNELGLHDMMGNVWEWVDDWYDKNYYRESHIKNPRGPRLGTDRVYRGAYFNSAEGHCRSSIRNYNKPGYRAINLGFRLARTP